MMTKRIVRYSMNNPQGLTLEDGTSPTSLKKGSVVVIRENEGIQRDLKIFGSMLLPLDSEAGKRVLFEAAFEADKELKVKALLKKMGKKNLADARGTEHAGYLNQFEKQQPDLVALYELLRQQPPPPEKPNFVTALFKKSFP